MHRVRKVRGRAVKVRAPDGRTAELPRVGAQTTPSVSVAPGVFDMNFFGREFAELVQWFRQDHGDEGVRVEVVTLSGERLDTLHISAIETGTRLSTRDDRLVVLPYSHISHIDVSILQDYRVPGFQLSTSSE